MAGPALREGAVAVVDGRVAEVGPAERVEGPVVHEFPGALLPGLVNAHAHLEYGPGFADLAAGELPFWEWIQTLTRRRQGLGAERWAAEAAGSAAAALRAGTTCVADVVTNGPGIAAAAGAGLAGVSYVEAVGAGPAAWRAAERARVEALLAEPPGPGRRLGLSPHTLYTLSTEVVRAVVARARGAGLRLHPHLAETAEEGEFVLAGTGPFAAVIGRALPDHDLLAGGCGRTPTARLAELGGLGPDVHVAHGVHVDATDRAALRAAGTAVALCVRSNQVLGAGTAPVAAYRAEGSPVALGTDSLASTPDLDLLAEARAARAVALAQGSPAAGLDAWLLAAATRGGAGAVGLTDCGRLVPGARADLAFIDCDPAEGETGVVHGRVVRTVLCGRQVAGAEPAG